MMVLPKEMVVKSDTTLGRFVLKEMRSKYDDNKSSKTLLMTDIIMALMETNIKSNWSTTTTTTSNYENDDDINNNNDDNNGNGVYDKDDDDDNQWQ